MKTVNNKFNIILENGEAILNVIKLTKRSDINEKTKLYYELGHYTNKTLTDWKGEGVFREIRNPVSFRDKINELDYQEYIEHHNFVIKEE